MVEGSSAQQSVKVTVLTRETYESVHSYVLSYLSQYFPIHFACDLCEVALTLFSRGMSLRLIHTNREVWLFDLNK
jgi:hypothetical protein